MRSKSRGFVKALGIRRGHCIVSPGKHRPHPRTLTFWLQVPRPGQSSRYHSLSLHCSGRLEFPVSGLWLGARVFVVCLIAHSCLMLFDPHGLQPARLLDPWGFSRQEYWSGLLCPPPGGLLNPGIKRESPVAAALTGGLFILSHLGSPARTWKQPKCSTTQKWIKRCGT